VFEILYGNYRSAKTRKIYDMIAEDVRNGGKCALIVPEQNVLESERELARREIYSLDLEVLSFRRLANSLFRKYGGLSYNYISEGGKAVVVWKTMNCLSDMLKVFDRSVKNDMSLVTLILSAINELQVSSVSPEVLQSAAERIDDPEQSAVIAELAEIYSVYSALLHEKYNDKTDDLTHAEQLLKENDCFSDKSVYIDLFSGFTMQELNIIRLIIRQSVKVVLTLGYDRKADNDAFLRLRRTDAALRKQADREGIKVIESSFDLAPENEEMNALQSRLFMPKVEQKCISSGFTRIVSCPGKRSEAEFVALDIRKKLVSGARYRDFTVIARSVDGYAGELRAQFNKYDIPYFVSNRTQVRNMQLTRLISAAFAMVINSCRCSDVISYLKTGFCGLDDDTCDMLVRYASVWKINGKRWYDADAWLMNPSGFGKPLDDRDIADLAIIDDARRKAMGPIEAFSEAFGNDTTVKSASTALFRLLSALEVSDKLERFAAELREAGSTPEAEEIMQLWNSVIEILDVLVNIAGEERITASEYIKLIELMFEKADIGKIPPEADTVTLASADLYRDTESGYVYIMGVNEGVFPARISEHGIISEKSRELLRDAGVELSRADDREKSADELLYFHQTATSATEGLVLTYNSDERRSIVLNSVKELYVNFNETDYALESPESKIASAASALEYAMIYKKTEAGKSIIDYLSAIDGKYGALGRAADQPLSLGECRIRGEVTDRIAGATMQFSQSKAEAYVKCPFSYFCKYVLGVREDAEGEAKANDIGNYIHSILERFFAGMSGRDLRSLADEEINEAADRCVVEYISSFLGNYSDKRTEYLYIRLTKLAKLIIKNILSEFSASAFRPVLFEYYVEAGGENSPLPLKVGDTQIKMSGFIDRIDSFVKDGKVFVRVIDYKTGNKEFSMSDIEKGLNLQMLIYLFSICESDSASLKSSLGADSDSEIVPAGVLYFRAREPDVETEDKEPSGDEAAAIILKGIKRSGVLTDDRAILSAMEAGIGGKYIPVVLQKNGKLRGNTASAEDFDRMKDQIKGKIEEIVGGIKDGIIDAKPMPPEKNGHSECAYCKYRSICRRREDNGDE